MAETSNIVVYQIGIPIEVCDKFEELALWLKREQHYRRYSADAILHQVRWHFRIDRGRRGFKINNNWSSVISRWAMKRTPELENFFETRELKSNGRLIGSDT